MIKKNNKGFTLIEVLGTVVILGILSTVVITSTLKYLNSSRTKSYYIMSQSIYEAAENCMIDNKCKVYDTISTDELINMGYIKNLKNPLGTKKDCSGEVSIYESTNYYSEDENPFNKYTFDVTLNCEGLKLNETKITWPNKINNSY